jgi:hypothetical protein
MSTGVIMSTHYWYNFVLADNDGARTVIKHYHTLQPDPITVGEQFIWKNGADFYSCNILNIYFFRTNDLDTVQYWIELGRPVDLSIEYFPGLY